MEKENKVLVDIWELYESMTDEERREAENLIGWEDEPSCEYSVGEPYHRKDTSLLIEKDIYNGLAKLEESVLKRIIKCHDEDGYIILSASRESLNNEENNERYRKLIRLVIDHKYSYIPIFGEYKEENSGKTFIEKSLIVFPYDIVKSEKKDFEIFFKDIVNICFSTDFTGTIEEKEELLQDSILVKRPNESPAFYFLKDVDYGTEKHKKFTWGNSFGNMFINDVQRKYFTALKSWDDISLTKKGNKKWQGSPKKYTYVESYLSESSKSIMDRFARFSEREMLDPKYPNNNL